MTGNRTGDAQKIFKELLISKIEDIIGKPFDPIDTAPSDPRRNNLEGPNCYQWEFSERVPGFEKKGFTKCTLHSYEKGIAALRNGGLTLRRVKVVGIESPTPSPPFQLTEDPFKLIEKLRRSFVGLKDDKKRIASDLEEVMEDRIKIVSELEEEVEDRNLIVRQLEKEMERKNETISKLKDKMEKHIGRSKAYENISTDAQKTVTEVPEWKLSQLQTENSMLSRYLDSQSEEIRALKMELERLRRSEILSGNDVSASVLRQDDNLEDLGFRSRFEDESATSRPVKPSEPKLMGKSMMSESTAKEAETGVPVRQRDNSGVEKDRGGSVNMGVPARTGRRLESPPHSAAKKSRQS